MARTLHSIGHGVGIGLAQIIGDYMNDFLRLIIRARNGMLSNDQGLLASEDARNVLEMAEHMDCMIQPRNLAEVERMMEFVYLSHGLDWHTIQ